jgi:hypothetical protein
MSLKTAKDNPGFNTTLHADVRQSCGRTDSITIDLSDYHSGKHPHTDQPHHYHHDQILFKPHFHSVLG